MLHRRRRIRLRRLERLIGRFRDLGFDLRLHGVELLGGRRARCDDQRTRALEGAARLLRVALLRRAVGTLVVGHRVRVGTRGVRMQHRGPAAVTRVCDDLGGRPVGVHHVRAVALHDVQAGEARRELRYAAARGLNLDRHADRVAVVLYDVDDRELQVARRVERLPELPLGGGAVAGADDDDFVVVVGRELEPRYDAHLGAGFGRADRLEELCAGRRRGRRDVEALVTEMRRHLATTGGRVGLGADGLQEMVQRGLAEREHHRPVAVVRVEPVLPGDAVLGDGHADSLVTGTGNLEEDLVLALQADLAVVDAARGDHGAVEPQKLLVRETGQVDRLEKFAFLSSHRTRVGGVAAKTFKIPKSSA